MEERSIRLAVFVIVLFAIIGIVVLALLNLEYLANNWYWLLILAAIVFVYSIVRFDYLIRLKEYERAVIFRFGRVNRVGGPGWCFVIRPIENYVLVDLRTKTIDVPKQDVITKDQIELRVDAVIYMHVKSDPQSVINSVVAVRDYEKAMETMVIAALRDVIGNMELPEVIANIEAINAKLKEQLAEASKEWGVEVESVEIKDVDIPREVLEAMHAERAAVKQKLARIHKADAHKYEVGAIGEAASKLSDKAIAYYYIRALEELAKGKSTKLFFPLEVSKLAEGIGNIFTPKMEKFQTVSSQSISPELVMEYKKILKEWVKEAVEELKKEKQSKRNKGKKRKSSRRKKR
ncbi:MAG: SPFH domain-containing protein [Candidatus Diapherotrites archaeon]|nr:SPFH domain-containing protein [Candidatus Diapherotrites archaeon]